MKKFLAELVGTFILVLFGVGTAVIAGDKVGIVGIAAAFGLAQVAAIYGIGPISGGHVNPAVSLGVWVAGRMSFGEMIGYWVAQFRGRDSCGMGAADDCGWRRDTAFRRTDLVRMAGELGYQGGYNEPSAILFEFFATMIFVIVILGSTQKSAPAGFAGLAIGITLLAIHLFGIHITGVSVNPARSLGPAIFVGGQAIKQLWLFLVFPSLGGIVAGLFFRTKLLAAE